MFPLSIKQQFLTLIFVFLCTLANGQDRKITPILNPGFDSKSPKTLVYIKADGPHDTIHQIWDFTRGVPTIIFTVASLNSTLNVTWQHGLPTDFTMSEKPMYTFALAVDKLYEYDDVEDTGHIDSHCPHKKFSLDHLEWTRNVSVLTNKETLVQLQSGKIRGGNIKIKLDLLPFKDYAVDLPHLIHTANSSLADISLVNLTSSREYNATRFSLRLVLVSTDSRQDTMHYDMRKSLDDEHTPGVFEIIEIKSPWKASRGSGGFVQFRPVAYTEPLRSVASSTIVHVSQINGTSMSRDSTMQSYFSGWEADNLLVQDVFISFGETGDGYYKQHNYTAWSFTAGYGSPPIETFSLFVVVIIGIGLGVPVLLALSSVLYLLMRRHRQTNNRARFNNDE